MAEVKWVVRESHFVYGKFGVVKIDDGGFCTKVDKAPMGNTAYYDTRSAAQSRADQLNLEEG